MGAGVFVLLLGVLVLGRSNMAIRCLVTLIFAAGYCVAPRSYSISENSILVKGLVGSFPIPLGGLREARRATSEDFRDCVKGTGGFSSGRGLIGYFGQYKTPSLGKCEMYVMNPSDAVVVITSAGTTVLSPIDRDGFLAAVWAAASVLSTHPAEPPLDPLQAHDARSPNNIRVQVAGSVAVVVLVALILAYKPGPPAYTLTAKSLTVHDRSYAITLQAAHVDVEHIRLIDFAVDAEWRPVTRLGYVNQHYSSGSFRVASGKTVSVYRTDSTRLVLLPPKGDGETVLLETANPEKFMREVRQAWGSRSPGAP
jgi:hypothetical protein